MVCWNIFRITGVVRMGFMRYQLKKIWWKPIGFKFIKTTQSSEPTSYLERFTGKLLFDGEEMKLLTAKNLNLLRGILLMGEMGKFLAVG